MSDPKKLPRVTVREIPPDPQPPRHVDAEGKDLDVRASFQIRGGRVEHAPAPGTKRVKARG